MAVMSGVMVVTAFNRPGFLSQADGMTDGKKEQGKESRKYLLLLSFNAVTQRKSVHFYEVL
jgi:hypothetical protein